MPLKSMGGRRISRRDFLNGVAVGVGALGTRSVRARAASPAEALEVYPPLKTGLRGSHAGSEIVAHALRDGVPLESFGTPSSTGETYDLVVVGGGLSGLAAAYFYQKAAAGRARILILENHDDVGGHSRRNEFVVNGRTYIGYGGTVAIDSPKPYGATAHGLITDLGINPTSWSQVDHPEVYEQLGLARGFFFDRQTFGQDKLLKDPRSGSRSRNAMLRSWQQDPPSSWLDFLRDAPLHENAKRDLAALYENPADPMPGVGSAEKKRRLARMSYARFLTEHMKVHPQVVQVLQTATHDLYGVGIDAVPAQDAWGLGLPGFAAMDLEPGAGPGMNHDAMPGPSSYFFHFPDGNASIARLLVRRLIPSALPGSTAEDAVMARLDYGRLDLTGERTRIRLNSLVARVKHVGRGGTKEEVEVAYVLGGKVRTVRAGACVMACWNGMIPYICPELPEAQREALAFGAKVPLLYTNVFLRNWTSFVNLGVRGVTSPGCYHTSLSLGHVTKIGAYSASFHPEEPAIVHLAKTPCSPGIAARDQHRAGRMELLTTPFNVIEASIRDQLDRVLGPGGFSSTRDVLGLTVNRWAHGYAYQYNSLWDPFWLEGGELPCVRGRKPIGRIAIANADAGAYAYSDGAIDQAQRAVQELLAQS